VRSEEGRGSEFWFTSRFEKQPAGEAATGHLPNIRKQTTIEQEQPVVGHLDWHGPTRTNIRVLLAEDNTTNQQVAQGMLRKLGLRADVVTNGREVLDALRSIPYDMVLMDVQMPGMDGLEATRAIRAVVDGSLNPNIPIIAMTAHAMQGDREICIAAGMDDYVAKPVAPVALSALMNRWLPRLDAPGGAGELSPTAGRRRPPDLDLRADARDVDFDEAVLLERLTGDRNLARTIVDVFLGDIPKQIEVLSGFLDAGDAKGVERQAHIIKGAAATVCGEGLMNVAFELELAGRSGDLQTATASFAELQNRFERLKEAMKVSDLLDTTK